MIILNPEKWSIANAVQIFLKVRTVSVHEFIDLFVI